MCQAKGLLLYVLVNSLLSGCQEVNRMPTPLDDLDAALIGALRSAPRSTEAGLARDLGVARGTVRARIERLQDRGVITGYGPDVDAASIGHAVLAFVTLEIAQGADEHLIEGLGAIREVLEVHAVSGQGDLVCRIVARSNDHLHDVILEILRIPGVTRSETHLALKTLLHRTAADLVAP